MAFALPAPAYKPAPAQIPAPAHHTLASAYEPAPVYKLTPEPYKYDPYTRADSTYTNTPTPLKPLPDFTEAEKEEAAENFEAFLKNVVDLKLTLLRLVLTSPFNT